MVPTGRCHDVARLNPGLRTRPACDNRLDGGRRAEKRQAQAPQRILSRRICGECDINRAGERAPTLVDRQFHLGTVGHLLQHFPAELGPRLDRRLIDRNHPVASQQTGLRGGRTRHRRGEYRRWLLCSGHANRGIEQDCKQKVGERPRYDDCKAARYGERIEGLPVRIGSRVALPRFKHLDVAA